MLSVTKPGQFNFRRFSIPEITMKKKDKKELVEKIAMAMAIALKKTDEQAARKIRKNIMAAAKEVVKRFARHLSNEEPIAVKSPANTAKKKAVKLAVEKRATKKVAVKKRTVRKKTAKRVRTK
jgi:CHAT domain-containing protein